MIIYLVGSVSKMHRQLRTHKYVIFANSSSKLSDTNKYNLNELHDDCSVNLLLRN